MHFWMCSKSFSNSQNPKKGNSKRNKKDSLFDHSFQISQLVAGQTFVNNIQFQKSESNRSIFPLNELEGCMKLVPVVVFEEKHHFKSTIQARILAQNIPLNMSPGITKILLLPTIGLEY